MDLSGLVFVGIIAVWAAYLVPSWMRRRDQAVESRRSDRFSPLMRLLHRRPPSAHPVVRRSSAGTLLNPTPAQGDASPSGTGPSGPGARGPGRSGVLPRPAESVRTPGALRVGPPDGSVEAELVRAEILRGSVAKRAPVVAAQSSTPRVTARVAEENTAPAPVEANAPEQPRPRPRPDGRVEDVAAAPRPATSGPRRRPDAKPAPRPVAPRPVTSRPAAPALEAATPGNGTTDHGAVPTGTAGRRADEAPGIRVKPKPVAPDPATAAPSKVVPSSATMRRPQTTPAAPVPSPRPAPAPRVSAARRRAQVCLVLLVATVAAWLGVRFTALPVWTGIVTSVLLVLDLVAGRVAAVHSQRQASLRALERARRTVAEIEAEAAAVSHHVVPTAKPMVRPPAPEFGPSKRKEAKVGRPWTPTPVPRPAYSLKATAPRPEVPPLAPPAVPAAKTPAPERPMQATQPTRPARPTMVPPLPEPAETPSEESPVSARTEPTLDLDAVLDRRRAI